MSLNTDMVQDGYAEVQSKSSLNYYDTKKHSSQFKVSISLKDRNSIASTFPQGREEISSMGNNNTNKRA